MNEMIIFENEQFGAVRVIEQDGEPWFVAADVCRALELEDTGRATSRLDEDELTRIKIVSGGQNREVIAVNEPGLYSLSDGEKCSPRNSSLHFSSLIALSTALCSLAYSFCSSSSK